jgi:hypothetical protein
MVELLGGFRISQALYAAAALGVADQLVAGPAPVQALAGHAGAHAPSTGHIARSNLDTVMPMMIGWLRRQLTGQTGGPE